MIWCAADTEGPPDLNIVNFGLEKEGNKQLEQFLMTGPVANINCENKNTTKFVEYYDTSDCESTNVC